MMIKNTLVIFLVVIGLITNVFCKKPPQNYEISELASTPPMGWNSFDSYGVYLHEKAAMSNVETFA